MVENQSPLFSMRACECAPHPPRLVPVKGEPCVRQPEPSFLGFFSLYDVLVLFVQDRTEKKEGFSFNRLGRRYSRSGDRGIS